LDRTKDALLGRIPRGPLTPPTRGAGLVDNQALLRALMINKPQIMGAPSTKALPFRVEDYAPRMSVATLKDKAAQAEMNLPYGDIVWPQKDKHMMPSNDEVAPIDLSKVTNITEAFRLPKNKSDAQKFMEALALQQLLKGK